MAIRILFRNNMDLASYETERHKTTYYASTQTYNAFSNHPLASCWYPLTRSDPSSMLRWCKRLLRDAHRPGIALIRATAIPVVCICWSRLVLRCCGKNIHHTWRSFITVLANTNHKLICKHLVLIWIGYIHDSILTLSLILIPLWLNVSSLSDGWCGLQWKYIHPILHSQYSIILQT